MASLFDEWVSTTGNEEEDLNESDVLLKLLFVLQNNITQQVKRRNVVEEQSTEDPIFTVELMNWIVPLNSRGQKIAGFVPPKLTSVYLYFRNKQFACGNNVILLGTSDKKLYRWRVDGQFQGIYIILYYIFLQKSNYQVVIVEYIDYLQIQQENMELSV